MVAPTFKLMTQLTSADVNPMKETAHDELTNAGGSLERIFNGCHNEQYNLEDLNNLLDEGFSELINSFQEACLSKTVDSWTNLFVKKAFKLLFDDEGKLRGDLTDAIQKLKGEDNYSILVQNSLNSKQDTQAKIINAYAAGLFLPLVSNQYQNKLIDEGVANMMADELNPVVTPYSDGIKAVNATLQQIMKQSESEKLFLASEVPQNINRDIKLFWRWAQHCASNFDQNEERFIHAIKNLDIAIANAAAIHNRQDVGEVHQVQKVAIYQKLSNEFGTLDFNEMDACNALRLLKAISNNKPSAEKLSQAKGVADEYEELTDQEVEAAALTSALHNVIYNASNVTETIPSAVRIEAYNSATPSKLSNTANNCIENFNPDSLLESAWRKASFRGLLGIGIFGKRRSDLTKKIDVATKTYDKAKSAFKSGNQGRQAHLDLFIATQNLKLALNKYVESKKGKTISENSRLINVEELSETVDKEEAAFFKFSAETGTTSQTDLEVMQQISSQQRSRGVFPPPGEGRDNLAGAKDLGDDADDAEDDQAAPRQQ